MSPSRPEPEGEDFLALVDAALAGDRAVINDLLRTLEPAITRVCRGRIGRSQGTFASADDVAQEVLLAVFHALDTYRGQNTRFRAFVFGIARNKINDYFRKVGREQHAQLDDAPDVAEHRAGPETAALRSEQGSEVSTLVNSLPTRQRDVLVLRVAVGYSVKETATALCTTDGAVRVTQSRALANLRSRIQNPSDER